MRVRIHISNLSFGDIIRITTIEKTTAAAITNLITNFFIRASSRNRTNVDGLQIHCSAIELQGLMFISCIWMSESKLTIMQLWPNFARIFFLVFGTMFP